MVCGTESQSAGSLRSLEECCLSFSFVRIAKERNFSKKSVTWFYVSVPQVKAGTRKKSHFHCWRYVSYLVFSIARWTLFGGGGVRFKKLK